MGVKVTKFINDYQSNLNRLKSFFTSIDENQQPNPDSVSKAKSIKTSTLQNINSTLLISGDVFLSTYLKCLHKVIDNKNKINWDYLSINPHPEAIELLRNNIDKINWNNISLNQSYLAMNIIKDNLNKINWYFLSSNKFAIELLIENKDKINWQRFNLNETNDAIMLLIRENKIDWDLISYNPSAFKLLILNKLSIVKFEFGIGVIELKLQLFVILNLI